MKKILIVGDSNTYGWICGEGCTGAQFPFSVTWPGVMAKALGEDYYVAADALCGRTTDLEPLNGTMSGEEYIAAITRENRPDTLMIMLGTNDLGSEYGRSADCVAEKLIGLAKAAAGAISPAPRILLISPPKLTIRSFWTTERSVTESERLAAVLESAARSAGVYFFDAASAVPSAESEDGVHFTRENHAALGLAAAEAVSSVR